MNFLVAGRPQILSQDGWLERMNATVRHTGNAIAADDVAQFSDTINVWALRAYRMAVGRCTREIAQSLRPDDLTAKVDPSRLQRLLDEGAVVEAARGIAEYWGRRTTAGLLLMPATRHCLIHLSEGLRLKHKR